MEVAFILLPIRFVCDCVHINIYDYTDYNAKNAMLDNVYLAVYHDSLLKITLLYVVLRLKSLSSKKYFLIEIKSL